MRKTRVGSWHVFLFFFPANSSAVESSILFDHLHSPSYWGVTDKLRTVPFPTTRNGPQNVTRLSEPAKLTTWRQENTYTVSLHRSHHHLWKNWLGQPLGLGSIVTVVSFLPLAAHQLFPPQSLTCTIPRPEDSHSPFSLFLYEYQYLLHNNDDEMVRPLWLSQPPTKVWNKRWSQEARYSTRSVHDKIWHKHISILTSVVV